jgi:TetR/AcrR family transcriptional repressor of nem operon
MGKGDDTRQRILDAAQASALTKGFGATSIEEIIAATNLTKSGFFYHFKDKTELAKALVNRYVETNERIYDDIFGRARELMDDPLQAFLLGLKMLSEFFSDMPTGHPGCLVAMSCYVERMFDREIQELNSQAALLWRRRFRRIFDEIIAIHAPLEPVDVDHLADMVSTVLGGGIALSKALREPRVLEQQILVFRSFIRLLFVPPPMTTLHYARFDRSLSGSDGSTDRL